MREIQSRWGEQSLLSWQVKELWKLPKIPDTPLTLTATATMAGPATCPNCGRVFKDDSAVLKHMNHRYGSCHVWFVNNPPTSPPQDPPPDTGSHSTYFPNAGHVHASGHGFLGWFHIDKDAAARSTNPYYPFLSKGEWELAEFLSCSGLSMKLIDKFLSLSLVSGIN